MNSLIIELFSAFGLGLFTVVHPCPLSTNIAAVSLIIGISQTNRKKILTVSFFVLGEMITYIFLGILLSSGAFKIPVVASFLQKYMLQLFGPILILIGMSVSGLFKTNQRTLKIFQDFVKSLPQKGPVGGILTGCLTALSFCPVSAALFFGVLVPLAISSEQLIFLPLFYGLGAAIPLIGIALAISKSASWLGKFDWLRGKYENNGKNFVGILLTVMGIFMSLRFIFSLV